MTTSASAAALEPARGPRRRWLTDAVIAGFIAIGTSTGALMVAYVVANGAADSQGDVLRRWLWQLTHVGDPVIVKGTGSPLEWGNGYTDWDRSFDEYVKGSALPPPPPVAGPAPASASPAPSPSAS